MRGHGWNWSIHPNGPKWTLVCKCGETFRSRIPKVDYPTIRCPNMDCQRRWRLRMVWESDCD